MATQQNAGPAEGNVKSDTNTIGDNTQKDPADWTTGAEPMTGAQKSYLKTLSEEAGETFDESLTKGEASMRIDALRKENPRTQDTPTK